MLEEKNGIRAFYVRRLDFMTDEIVLVGVFVA